MKIKLIELFKNIKRNIVSFLSLSIFIFLAVTLFQGLDFTGNAVLYSIDRTFNETNTYDIKLNIGTVMSESFVNGLTSIEDVDDVEGFFTASDDINLNGKVLNASIHSITKNITKTNVIDGRLPENDNEIVIYKMCANDLDIKIGDQITFTRNNFSYYTQGLVERYITTPIAPTVLENAHNFKNDTFTVTGTVMFGDILNHEPGAHPMDMDSGIPVKASFFVNYSAFNPLITSNKFNGVYIRSNSLKGLKYFEDEYIDKANEIKDAIVKYYGNIEGDYDKYVDVFEDATDLLSYARNFLHENDYIDDVTFLDDDLFSDTLYDMLENVVGKASMFKASTRNEIVGTIMAKIMSELFINDRYAIGGVFFIISLLICFSVITRLVSDDARLIGTKKALGFTRREVTMSYLSFSFIAVIIAILLGNIGAIAIEKIIVPVVFKKCFIVLYYTNFFSILLSLIIAALLFVIIGAITLIACSGVIRKKTILLLQGKDESLTKNKSRGKPNKLFAKTSLFNKTVFRNFKYDLKRIFATVFGISASLALLISSFSLKFTSKESFDRQFNELFFFDTIVYVDGSVENGKENLESFYQNKNLNYSPLYRDFVTLTVDEKEDSVGYVYVYFDNASFNKLVNVSPSDESPKFSNQGYWLPESYQKELKCDSKTKLSITCSSGETIDTETTGFFSYYNYQCAIFVDANTYENSIGKTISPNAYLVDRHKIDLDEFEKTIGLVDGYLYSYDFYSKAQTDVQIFDLVLTVCYSLYLFATAVLSFFVILNLFVTNVKEKKKEILTLMVNGYSRKQSSKYVYLDTIFLTLISLIIGTGLGIFLAWYGQISIESKFLYFIHRPNVSAILLSIPITILLVILMTIISIKEIKKFKLTDANNA